MSRSIKSVLEVEKMAWCSHALCKNYIGFCCGCHRSLSFPLAKNYCIISCRHRLGEKAVEAAKKNGLWDASPSGAISDEQIASFSDKLSDFSPANENFMKMSHSAKVAFVRRYLSFKKEETRQKDFKKIVDMLKQNLKPSINSKG